ncbi:hypothetical protein VP1G_09545 [Cytospora mali]|uniref:Uncharacterized protein n=1 Tax=Cytospora mali TaxID=578113 RepID=A0A194VEX3_CYTMA|nr:hypothetical protein VP1G_09545 [Valsa mali var. pyri (nom. inval.)]
MSKVQIFYDDQEVEYLNFNQVLHRHEDPIDFAPFWFPDIIDKKFNMTPNAQYPYGVTIQSIPMWRGVFLDKSVVRHEKVIYYHHGSIPPPGGPGNPVPPTSIPHRSRDPSAGHSGGPGPSTSVPDRSRDPSASRSGDTKPPNAGAVRGNKNSGGNSESGKASSATQV